MQPFVRITALALALCAGCATTVEPPERAVAAYVDAVRAGEWGRAYRLLGEDARDGMTAAEYREFCADNEELVRTQAEAIGAALDASAPRVMATVPVDRLRNVSLEHDGGRWFLAEGVPLATGADTPVASMEQLAAALDSEGVTQLLALLSEDMRARYMAEIDAIVDALARTDASALAVYGDSASVEVGEITIHLVREAGAWHVSDVEQPYAYDDDYYYEDW